MSNLTEEDRKDICNLINNSLRDKGIVCTEILLVVKIDELVTVNDNGIIIAWRKKVYKSSNYEPIVEVQTGNESGG